MIFETHAHYEDGVFDDDREELLSSFPQKGIERVINVSSSVESIDMTIELTQKYPFIYGAVGIHPQEIDNIDEDVYKKIADLCGHPKVAAVGEVGLDYYWNSENKAVQKAWFERFIELGKDKNLPVVIHSRDAAKDTLDILKSVRVGEAGAVIHCYSYSKEMAKQFLDMGFYFGVGGVVTFKNAKKLIETVEYLPLESILLETDSPYLAPVPYRGKRNSSLYIPYIAEKIAEIKGISSREVIRVTNENAGRLFTKAV